MIAWTPENVARLTAGLQPATPNTPRITVDPERVPGHYMADVVRHMRGKATSLHPSRIGPGAGIDRAMLFAGIDADDALGAWRAS